MVNLLFLTIIVFIILAVFFLPKVLYFGALIYHAFFRTEEKRKKSSNYSLSDLKEVRSEKVMPGEKK